MGKIIKILVLILIAAIWVTVLAACGTSNQASGNDNVQLNGNNNQDINNQDNNQNNIQGNNNQRGGRGNNAGFGRGNFPGGFGGNTPDLYGEVKSISGNNITIALIEIPQRRQPSSAQGQPGDSTPAAGRGGGQNQNGDNGQNVNPDNTQGTASGNGQNQNASNSSNPRGGRGGGFMRQITYTGESLTINVPSGTPITTFAMGGNPGTNGGSNSDTGNNAGGNNGGGSSDNPVNNNTAGNFGNSGFGNFQEKQLQLTGIQVGMLLQIWYKKDDSGSVGDNKVIENIRVMQNLSK